MPHHEQAVEASISHRRSLLVSYSEGAIPIPIPHNPSTPVARSKPSRCAPYQRLYTGPPVDPVEGYHTAPATSSRPSNGTPSPNFRNTAKIASHTPFSTTSIPLSTLPQGPHPLDPAETFAAARLESLIPLPFIASASDDRHNVILPPSAPKLAPTRYTILFDAAHDIIMHQSIINGTTQSARQKKQLEELTRISYRQAKFILQLEKENAMLRGWAGDEESKVLHVAQIPVDLSTATPTSTSTKKGKKRKRGEMKNDKQEQVAYVDGFGNKIEGIEQEEQRKERAKKTWKLQKQRESLIEEPDEIE